MGDGGACFHDCFPLGRLRGFDLWRHTCPRLRAKTTRFSGMAGMERRFRLRVTGVTAFGCQQDHYASTERKATGRPVTKRNRNIAPGGFTPWLLDGIALAACAAIVFAFALAPAGV